MIKTNKTKVANSIAYINEEYKNIEEIKKIIRLRRLLRCRTKYDIESINHVYNDLVRLYVLSCKRMYHWYIESILKNTIKEILKSDIEIESYNKEYLDYLVQCNLL